MSAALPGQVDSPPAPEEKMDKSLQKENKKLKGDIKQMEMKIKAMQSELTKSFTMKDRLEALCRELQKQNKFIKAESSSKIQEANARGKELASEVQNNMGFMKSINDNLASISQESLTVKRENEELAKKIGILKGHYEEREQILQSALKETNDSLHKAKVETGETKLKCAEEKEKLIGEMQKLADALLQSREQIKEAKETEISLRTMIQGYEDKFNGLQKALKDTNGSYEEFRSEMNKVTSRTKELEGETVKWQQRWEESNVALSKMRENYLKVKEDLGKSYESLEKMKSLCRQLHTENRDLQEELKGKTGNSGPGICALPESEAATLASITIANGSNTNTSSTDTTEVKLTPETKPVEVLNQNEQAKTETVAEQINTAAPIIQEVTTNTPPATSEVKPLDITLNAIVDSNGNTPSAEPLPTSTAPKLLESPSTQDESNKSDGESHKGKKNKRKKNKK